MLYDNASGSVIVNSVVAEQPLASVATIVYVPATREAGLVAVTLFTVYVIVPVPPSALNVNDPSSPLHSALVAEDVLKLTAEDGSVTVGVTVY